MITNYLSVIYNKDCWYKTTCFDCLQCCKEDEYKVYIYEQKGGKNW